MKKFIGYLKLILVFSTIMSCGASWSQEVKHPRVIELEDSLNKMASTYIKDRFPNIPFMVTSQVDPLRREVKNKDDVRSESLPYYDLDVEEIQDEWDNPQVPTSVLINRSKKILVTVSVPEKLRQTDVDELKEGLSKYLHLTPVRDEVSFSRKEWPVNEIPWTSIYFSATVIATLLAGLLVINRTSANRIATALSSIKFNDQGNSSNHLPPMAIEKETRDSSPNKNNEVKFNDPIRLKELASKQVGFLVAQPQFPTHLDIFILDKLGKENPADLGAILSEFPASVQERIFAFSGDFYWLKALHAPGSLNFRCIETIQQLIQTPKDGFSTSWIQTVLSVWRLGDERAQFLKSLDRNDAFAILNSLPKGLAVSDAKKAFPGSWASILDASEKAKLKDVDKLKRIEQAALAIKPLNTLSMLEEYKTVQEILEFLKHADPGDERDIYGAAPPSSLIHTLRAPFYKIFEGSDDTLKNFAQRFSTDKWALALFNLAKPDRVKIESHFSEKQRFQFIERIKRLDINPPSKNAVGNAREEIATQFSQLPKAKENINVDESRPAA